MTTTDIPEAAKRATGSHSDTRQFEKFLGLVAYPKNIVVMLGENPAPMQIIASHIRDVVNPDNYKLDTDLQEGYRGTKVLVAADAVHALQLVKEYGLRSIAAIVAPPQEREANELSIILDHIDEDGLTEIYRPNLESLQKADAKDAINARIRDKVNYILRKHKAIIGVYNEHKESAGKSDVWNTAPLFNPDSDKTLHDIMPQMSKEFQAQWGERERQEFTDTKRTVPKDSSRDLSARTIGEAPTVDCVENIKKAADAFKSLEQLTTESLGKEDYHKSVGVANDRRVVREELKGAVETILYCASSEEIPEERKYITRFVQHATAGMIGIFPESTDSREDVNRSFIFIKPQKTAADVERAFSRYEPLKERGIKALHEPLAYYHSPQSGTFGVISRSPLLAVTAKVAEKVRELGPDYYEVYLNALMEVGLDFLMKYKTASHKELNDPERARILHYYKATLETAIPTDLAVATGKVPLDKMLSEPPLSGPEGRILSYSLWIFDDPSLWQPKIFGPIMDWKEYNHGHLLGTITPTAEWVKERLFEGLTPHDIKTNKGGQEYGEHLRDVISVESSRSRFVRNIQDTFALLEYGERDGITAEDSHHQIDSPRLKIPFAERAIYEGKFIRRLMGPDATDADLSSVWMPDFAMGSFKSLRKMQRTIHYMVNNYRFLGDTDEAMANHQAYLEDYRMYANWFKRSTTAAIIHTDKCTGLPFEQQVKALNELYGDEKLRLPSNPGKLRSLSEAFYGWMLAYQRLVEGEPKIDVLKHLEVNR